MACSCHFVALFRFLRFSLYLCLLKYPLKPPSLRSFVPPVLVPTHCLITGSKGLTYTRLLGALVYNACC